MWPIRVYTRKKPVSQRLNLTPTPDLSAPAKAEAHCLKGKRKARGLPKVVEKAEHSRRGGSGSGPLSTQLRVTEEKSRKENSTNEETQDEKSAPLNESVTDLQIDNSSSDSELISGLSLQDDISSSLWNSSVTDSCIEYDSSKESLSSFSSPELFRGSGYLDWECPKLEEHMQYRNSTLLDSSKAVAIENVSQFLNLSAILDASSEDYEKYHRKTVMTLADQNLSPEPKSTSNLESDNAACEVLLAEKPCPPDPEKTKRKLEKENESRDKNFQTKLNLHCLKSKVPTSHHRFSVEEDDAGPSVLLPQPLESELKIIPTIPNKKRRDLLTSTPSSQTSGFVIDLSSVRKASFEELFPIVSNYVNSNEIIPMSSLQEDSSSEIPSNTSEICCIIRASPGTRHLKIKDGTVKKKYSPCKDIPQDIIINTNDKK